MLAANGLQKMTEKNDNFKKTLKVSKTFRVSSSSSFWPFFFNIFNYASFACLAPFIVLFYQGLGFSGAQIGVLIGVTPLITLVASPLWTGLADTRRLHRPIMTFGLLAGAVVVALIPRFHTFLPILLLVVLLQIAFAPIAPLVDSASMHMLGDRRDMYGRVRLGGTIGYGVAVAIAGGLVQKNGLTFAFYASAVLALIGLLISQKLVHGPAQAAQSDRGSIRQLLASPRWLVFLAVAFANGLAVAANNSFLFPFLKELGANEMLMGFILTLGTISEVPVLFFGNRLVKWFSPYRLFLLGTFVTGARFLLFALATSPALILILQVFGGLTFTAMWIGAVAYAYENAPAGFSATAQGLLSATVFGFGIAVGGFSGGLLLDAAGGRGLFTIFGLVTLAILGLAMWANTRIEPKGSY